MNGNWIGAEYRGNPAGRFAYFRLDAELPAGAYITAEITAAAQYRLWVNEQPVCSGPCMGDSYVWYSDTVDLSAYLQPGINHFAAQVICLDPADAVDQMRDNTSLIRLMVPDHRHRFAFSAAAGDTDLSTGKADWRVLVDEGISLQTEKITEFLGAASEKVDFHAAPASWKTQDCSAWPQAPVLETVEESDFNRLVGVCKRYRVEPRPIPMLFEREESFIREVKTETGLLENGCAEIGPHSTFEAILDAGQVKVTRPVFPVDGGAGGELEITYFEKFTRADEVIPRNDWRRGDITGARDCVSLSGGNIRYEPFFIRTFRFIRLRLKTEDQGACLSLPSFRRTGYPMTEDSRVSSSAPWVSALWRMCAETLQNCMLSSFMDCPYYEQLQYIMDTRLQVLFSFTLSRDARLARKALEDFHRSILPCGLLPGKYPSAYLQVISTFSLHYIFMIREYYLQTGDTEVLRRYRPDCDRILDYFGRHLSANGLMGHPGFWPFVDWQDAWADSAGVPAALREGESTILSLMFAYALDCAADINDHSGRPALAAEYRERKDRVCGAVRQFCWDEDRQLYREGPAFRQFTQHAQAWAVLCGIGDERCIRAALRDPEVLRVTFSTSNEWFRALEKTGLYDFAAESLKPWIGLITLDCKTCPETPGLSRSENHAWSAQPMLELIRCIAGIRQDGTGWKRITVEPHLLDLPDLSGTAATPEGDIVFSFAADKYQITLPDGMTGTFRLPDGRTAELRTGYQVIR